MLPYTVRHCAKAAARRGASVLSAAIFRWQFAVGLLEARGEAALALIADGLRNGCDVILRGAQARGRRLHAVLFDMCGDGLAIDLLEELLQMRYRYLMLRRTMN